MKFKKKFVLFFLISSLKILMGQVVEDSIKIKQLQEIVVTGTRTERSVSTLPIPAYIITGENIEKLGLSRLNEIIQEQTGLVTVPDFGGGEGIQIQGLDASYVMILIDGQPLLGRSAGTLDLSRISINNIEKIEIIKGASSSLYGSEALAGVVNIITKKNVIIEKLKGNSNYKFATYGTHDFSANIEYAKRKVGISLFANYFKTNGYNLSESDFLQTVEPYYNFTFQPKIKINFSEKINLLINSRNFRQYQDNKGIIGVEKYNGQSKINEWNNGMIFNHFVSTKLKFIYDIYATRYKAYENLNDKDNYLFEDNEFDQLFFRPELRAHYKIGKNTFSMGMGINYESLERTYFEKKAVLNSEYIFGQFEYFIKDRWNILTGFRYDKQYQYKSQFSPKAGVNYKWNESFFSKISIGYGYKAPDLRQLYFNFTNSAVGYTVLGYNVAEENLSLLQNQGQILFINEFSFESPLKPESSLNFNMGGMYKKNNLSLEYNFFYNSIINLIDTRAIAQKNNGQNVFSYFNVDKIFTYGSELNLKYKSNFNLMISFGYQYLIAKDQTILKKIKKGEVFRRDPISLSSLKLRSSEYFGLFNRSRHTANIKIDYVFPRRKISVNARVFYKSKYGAFDTNNNTILDKYDSFVKEYFLTNIAFSKDFKYQISLQMGVNNLFNYTDRSNISNLPGRLYYTRIQYQF